MSVRIFEARNRAFSLLEAKGLDVGSVPLLLQHITSLSHANYLANMQTELSDAQAKEFWDKMAELLAGKPIQYVLGEERFYGRDFMVNEDVLIPRPETEELIWQMTEKMQAFFQTKKLKVADIGTGSGAIAITMKLEHPSLEVTATDISQAALAVAAENARRLGAKVAFKCGDLGAPIAHEKWDIILSNPPYIADAEASLMTRTVLDFEPHTALFAEEDGLACYRKLAEQLPNMLAKRALIGLEIGFAQGESVAHLFQQAFPQATIEILQDINGKDRMLFCKLDE